jgi:hypothetical protein
MANAKNINLETGKTYKINGRVYTVTDEKPVGAATAKYTARQFIITGKRGAVRGVDIRHNGTAWTWGCSAGQIEEIATFETL